MIKKIFAVILFLVSSFFSFSQELDKLQKDEFDKWLNLSKETYLSEYTKLQKELQLLSSNKFNTLTSTKALTFELSSMQRSKIEKNLIQLDLIALETAQLLEQRVYNPKQTDVFTKKEQKNFKLYIDSSNVIIQKHKVLMLLATDLINSAYLRYTSEKTSNKGEYIKYIQLLNELCTIMVKQFDETQFVNYQKEIEKIKQLRMNEIQATQNKISNFPITEPNLGDSLINLLNNKTKEWNVFSNEYNKSFSWVMSLKSKKPQLEKIIADTDTELTLINEFQDVYIFSDYTKRIKELIGSEIEKKVRINIYNKDEKGVVLFSKLF